MFTFFKSRPTLKSLIPENYIDFHSHVLPGIDDGAKSLTDSHFLVGEMQKMGFSQIITTPHVMENVWENTPQGVLSLHAETRASLAHKYDQLVFNVGAEYYIDAHFVKLFKSEPLLTIKDNYVLIEISYIAPPIQLFEVIFELQVAGYIPVLAHPERYAFYHNNFDDYRKLKNAGCLFQLNLLSTVGYYGKNVAQCASKLLAERFIDFTGSDIHHRAHIQAFDQKVQIADTAQLVDAMNRNQRFRF